MASDSWADLFQDAGKKHVKFLALAAGRDRTQLHEIGELNGSAQLQEQALIVAAIGMGNIARQGREVQVDRGELEGHGAGIRLIREQQVGHGMCFQMR
jgi:hypothetical protein